MSNKKVVLEMQLENNKAVKCFNLKSDGKNIQISGDAGEGKTTAASTLWSIIKKGPDTVTHGEKKCVIRLKIGDPSDTENYIHAERKTTKSGKSEVTLQHVRGEKRMDMTMNEFKSMVSGFSENPQDIANMGPTELVATLTKAAKLSIDLDATDASIVEAETNRLNAKRDADRTNPGDEPEKAESVSVTELVMEKDEIDAKNVKINDAFGRLIVMNGEQAEAVTMLEEAQNAVDELKKAMEARKIKIDIAEKWKETAKLTDTDGLVSQISNAEGINERANAHQVWSDKNEEHKRHEKSRTDADDKVKELRDEKKEALDKAEWPLEGLCVDDGKVMYNDAEFINLGMSDRFKICVALTAEIIERDESMKVIRMDGIESMSVKDFDEAVAICDAKGIQIISTRVARNGDAEPGEIVIKDGVIKEEEK